MGKLCQLQVLNFSLDYFGDIVQPYPEGSAVSSVHDVHSQLFSPASFFLFVHTRPILKQQNILLQILSFPRCVMTFSLLFMTYFNIQSFPVICLSDGECRRLWSVTANQSSSLWMMSLWHVNALHSSVIELTVLNNCKYLLTTISLYVWSLHITGRAESNVSFSAGLVCGFLL